MIFKYIKLINFRQYKNENYFEFSDPRIDKKMTLIIAKNGVGKTTFLQAFRYCFYGSSSNYLKLPRSDELLNNTLINDLRQMDNADLCVEVCFEHNNIDYIARRSQTYIKKHSKMTKLGKEKFTLLYSTKQEGYKSLDQASSEIKIWQILPPGLSHVFLFDGERMEKRIESNDYKSELKESILGILDLKKIDNLIKHIGSEVKSRSILGVLNGKISHSTDEEKKLQRKHDTLQERIEKKEELRETKKEEIEKLKEDINKYRSRQKEIEEYNIDIVKLEKLESEFSNTEIKLKSKGDLYISTSGKAIINKLLLSRMKNYDKFVKKDDQNKRFFQYLHVDTLSDILSRGECICGSKILKGTKTYDNINELFDTALPIESAHHLNKIGETFKRTVDFKEQLDYLKTLKGDIVSLKSERRKIENKIELLKENIRNKEKEMGESTQVNIDDLQHEVDEKILELGALDGDLIHLGKAYKKIHAELQVLLRKNVHNDKIRAAIEDLKNIKDILKERQIKKDEEAREILSRLFNNNLSNVIVGNYSISIDSKYNLSIVDNNTSNNVTDIMSTGQSVIISLSFIKSLIETAGIISKQIDKNESYGVIMDAALSNVDETHINNLCKNNLNGLEQLIFLSFKKQLRNEMYDGIKENIGKAYVLEIEGDHLKQTILADEELKEFIHEKEEN